MRHISEVGSRELRWIQPSVRQSAYELRAGDEVVATVRCQEACGSLADATAGDSHWTFKRTGFWHPRVTVRVPGSDADVANFSARWTGTGTLELPPERRFHWGAANAWQSQWAWQDAEGTPLVHVKGRQGLVKVEGQVEITPAAVALPELDLLVALGWYLVVLRARENAAVAGTVVVVTS
jgi:hypothetical protein